MSIEARKIRLIMKLRRSGVTSTAVLSALERVRREDFLPPAFQDRAYEDTALPIDCGQTISQPLIVALMTQELKVKDRHKILEIGTGSGYQTSILSLLCRRVYTIERHAPLLKTAEKRLHQQDISNFTAKVGDGSKGWSAQAPFDRIIVTAGGGTEPPPALLEQLSENGIMLIPLGNDLRMQEMVRFTRIADGFEREVLWPVRFVPLIEDLTEEKKCHGTQ